MRVEAVRIIDTWPERPVFHRPGTVRRNEHGDFIHVMACGARVDVRRWWSAMLRRDQAERFARACQNCYRGEVVV